MSANDLREENNTILKLTLIADKFLLLLEDYRKHLNNFQNNCKCNENINNKLKFIELENDFKCVYEEYNENKYEITEELNDIIEKRSVFKPKTNQTLAIRCTYKGCDYKTYIRRYLEKHKRKIHFNKTSLKCNECHLRFWGIRRLQLHMKSAHVKGVTNRSKIKDISDIIKSSKSGFYDCYYPNCFFRLKKSKEQVIRHIVYTHLNKSQINCSKCDLKFWGTKNLLQHMTQTHNNNVKYFKCDWNDCRFVSKYLNELNMHKTKHFEEKAVQNIVNYNLNSKKTDKHVLNDSIGDEKIGEGLETRDSNCNNLVSVEIMDICLDKVCLSESKEKASLMDSVINQLLSETPNRDEEQTQKSTKPETNENSVEKFRNKATTCVPLIFGCNYPNCNYWNNKNKSLLTLHKRIHLNKNQLKCYICSLSFSESKSFKQHIHSFHHKTKSKRIQIEKDSVHNQTNKLIENQFEKTLFKCDFTQCQFQCESPLGLKEHKSQHFNQNIDKIINKLMTGINRSSNEVSFKEGFLEKKSGEEFEKSSCTKESSEETTVADHWMKSLDETLNQIQKQTQGLSNNKELNSSNTKNNENVICAKNNAQDLITKVETEVFHCNYPNCNFETKTLQSFYNHRRAQHFYKSQLKCFKCELHFSGMKSLKQHNNSVHSQINKSLTNNIHKNIYQCDSIQCQFQCESLFILNEHKRQHLNQNIDNIITQFKTGINKSHDEFDTEEEVFINAEEFLDKKYEKCSQFEDKLMNATLKSTDHENEKNSFKCDSIECEFQCQSLFTLREHKRQHLHQNISQITSELETGINRSQNQINVKEEVICLENVLSNNNKQTSDETIITINSSEDQLTNKTQNRNDDQFVFGSNLFSKKRLQGLKGPEELSESNINNTISKGKELINKRLYSLKNPSINSNLKCEKCNKEFLTRIQFTQHMARNHSDFKYNCDWSGCQFGCHYLYEFEIHMRRHTGEKPYKCSEKDCQKSFINTNQLNKHLKRTHEYCGPRNAFH